MYSYHIELITASMETRYTFRVLLTKQKKNVGVWSTLAGNSTKFSFQDIAAWR
jgi:hypothetical protein